MIGRLKGQVVHIEGGVIILDVHGVGYEVQVPLNILGKLEGEVELSIHTHVREDAFLLYGFLDVADRESFRTLLGVSSIGPKSALSVMSVLDAEALASIVARGEHQALVRIPGIGKKTAERIVLELRDKIGKSIRVPMAKTQSPDLAAALYSMGFKPHEIDKVVQNLPTEKTFEERLKMALQKLA